MDGAVKVRRTGHEVDSHIRPSSGGVERVLHPARRAFPEAVARPRRERRDGSTGESSQSGQEEKSVHFRES